MPHNEMTWDSEITHEERQFKVLPPGDYNFEVVHFERERHSGSEKIPPCPKAVVHIRIQAEDGQETTVRHNLYLHKNVEGLLADFFVCIGQMTKGGTSRMNWNEIVGSTGRCRVGIYKYTNSKGEPAEINEIRWFHEPEAKPAAATPSYQAGTF